MIGINSILKLLRRSVGPHIEARGLLPHRYYLHRALDALDVDDIDQAVQMVTLAGDNKKRGRRWRIICQQIIFRCRVLASLHERQMALIRAELQGFEDRDDIRDRCLRLSQLLARARGVLRTYELSLLEQLSGRNSDAAPPPETSPIIPSPPTISPRASSP